MEVTPVQVDAVKITNAPGLDQIHAFWMDVGPGQGYVTIICYGKSWTAYFGGMRDGQNIRQFFDRADTEYLVCKMGYGPKRDIQYLTKIINAVKESLVASREQPFPTNQA